MKLKKILAVLLALCLFSACSPTLDPLDAAINATAGKTEVEALPEFVSTVSELLNTKIEIDTDTYSLGTNEKGDTLYSKELTMFDHEYSFAVCMKDSYLTSIMLYADLSDISFIIDLHEELSKKYPVDDPFKKDLNTLMNDITANKASFWGVFYSIDSQTSLYMSIDYTPNSLPHFIAIIV